MKRCGHCQVTKALSEYYPAKHGRYNRQSWCRECAVQYSREWRRAHPEQHRATRRRYVAQDPDRIRQWQRNSYTRRRSKLLAQAREKYQRNREEILSKNRAYRIANRDKVLARQRAHREKHPEKQRLYHLTHPEVHAYHSRKTQLRRYGLSPEDYATMLARQGGVCAICGRPPKRRALSVDHNHKTGKVRGLLCDHCNLGLMPLVDAHPDWATRIGDYLAQFEGETKP